MVQQKNMTTSWFLNQLVSRNFIGLLTELETDRGQTLLFGGLGQMGRGTPEYGEWRGQGRAKLFTTLLINARRNTPKVPAIKPNKVPNLVFCGEII